MNKTDKREKRSNLLNEFMWWCAGVNKSILRQCPTDYAKYAGIGGTILFTAMMAMLSGGYAMFFVFDKSSVAIVFGVFWGLLIFNLDRFIVNTMYSDGKVTISWREFYSGLPRIIMAVFLGIVISTPLELKIYEKSINTELKSMKQEKLTELLAADEERLKALEEKREAIMSRPLADEVIDRSDSAGTDMKTQIANLRADYNYLQSRISELKARLGRLSRVSDSAQYANVSRQINTLTKQRNNVQSSMDVLTRQLAATNAETIKVLTGNREKKAQEIARIDSNIATLSNKIESAEREYAMQLADEFDGFQGRMAAFNKLKQNRSTWWAALFISLLFIIIETAPTFFKMMIASGPYDDMLRAEMHRVRVLSDKQISDINDEVNTQVQISVEKNKARLEAELLANKDVMERVALAQAELLQSAIDQWRDEELQKIAQDPSAYITLPPKA